MSSLFLIAVAVFLLLLAGWIFYIETRLKNFFKGASGKDLESVISSMQKDLARFSKNEQEQEQRLSSVDKRLRKSIQHTKTLRFNPFDDAGSNQSFAVALLDEEGDGVAISSLYSRDKVGVYAKPVEKYQSEYPLSEEEKEVIRQVKENE